MKKEIEDAVLLLAAKITKDIKSEDALRFTQAALNLEHVLDVRANLPQQK